MNKQLLLNGVILLSMVGTLLQGAEGHPVVAATQRLKAAMQAVQQAQKRGAPPEELAPLQAEQDAAHTDLARYDIGFGSDDDASDSSDSSSSSNDSSDGAKSGAQSADNNHDETEDESESDSDSASSGSASNGGHAPADTRDETAQSSAVQSDADDTIDSDDNDGTDDEGDASEDDSSGNNAATIQASPASKASSWNRARIGKCIFAAWVYRFVIAPRLAKRVRKMQKGRMRKLLSILTFAKRTA